jgi:hypothetical protein
MGRRLKKVVAELSQRPTAEQLATVEATEKP